jgi:hypothetical protein
LPVIGFATMSYTNGTLVVGSQNVLSNYGGSFVHKMSTLCCRRPKGDHQTRVMPTEY